MDLETRAYLEQTLGALRNEFGALRNEFGALRGEFGALRDEFGALRQEMRETAEETRRHFHVIAEDLRHDIRGVAEGVIGLSERVDRMDTSLRAEMSERFAGAHAVIRVIVRQVRRDIEDVRSRL